MILVNRNFGNPALSQAISDMFKPTTNDDLSIDTIVHSNALASGSTLVGTLESLITTTLGNTNYDTNKQLTDIREIKDIILNVGPKNFFIVTEHFLKVLDKVYTKIWNESFTETAIYTPSNLASIYTGFVTDNSSGDTTRTFKYKNNTKTAPYNFMLFKTFVDRAITAGVLDETDRLDYQDYVLLNSITKTNLSTQVDLDNKLITMSLTEPTDITPDINTQEGSYLYGKKLYLMMTPFLPNYSTSTNITGPSTEPFISYLAFGSTGATIITSQYKVPVHRPIAFFKPKTPESKFGRSLPLATHFIWRIGTQADKDLAEIEGTEVPEIIFDHLNRISHIDNLKLEIKYDNLQF